MVSVLSFLVVFLVATGTRTAPSTSSTGAVTTPPLSVDFLPLFLDFFVRLLEEYPQPLQDTDFGHFDLFHDLLFSTFYFHSLFHTTVLTTAVTFRIGAITSVPVPALAIVLIFLSTTLGFAFAGPFSFFPTPLFMLVRLRLLLVKVFFFLVVVLVALFLLVLVLVVLMFLVLLVAFLVLPLLFLVSAFSSTRIVFVLTTSTSTSLAISRRCNVVIVVSRRGGDRVKSGLGEDVRIVILPGVEETAHHSTTLQRLQHCLRAAAARHPGWLPIFVVGDSKDKELYQCQTISLLARLVQMSVPTNFALNN
eukprot:g5328.t1